MPRPTGKQWDAFGDEPVYSRAIGIINQVADDSGPAWNDGILTPEETRHVFRAANIRSWPLAEHPTNEREGWTEYESTVYPTETLHTTQDYLHAPTIRKYMEHGAPEFDPEYSDMEYPYRPEVLETERGTKWINEGHHRLVASRLNKEWSTDVHGGPLVKRPY